MTNNPPLISIIIPIYNVERYLPECVDSILAQTYSNLEIILVDDGSQDNCPQICDEYASKDSRVKVIHKQNGGQADARNAGLDLAAGEYISFVDSDDWVAPDMLEFLYSTLLAHNADISCCGVYRSYVGANIIPPRVSPPWESHSMTGFDAAVKAFSTMFDASTWAKLYNKAIFETYRYPQDRICNDSLAIIDVLMSASIVAIDMTPKYHYRKRKSSIVHEVSSATRVRQKLEIFEKRHKIIEESYPGLIANSEAFLYNRYIHAIGIILSDGSVYEASDNYKAMASILKKVKANAVRLLRNPYLTIEEKLNLLLLAISIRFHKPYIKFQMLMHPGRTHRRKKKRKFKQSEMVLFD